MRDTRDFPIGNVRIDGNLRRRWSVDGNYGARDGGDIRNVDVIGDVSDNRNVNDPRDAGHLGHVGNVRLRVEQHCGVFDTDINLADNAGWRGSNRNSLGIDRNWQPWSQLRGSCADTKRIADDRVCSTSTNRARGYVSAHGFDDSDKPVPLSDSGGRRHVEFGSRLLRPTSSSERARSTMKKKIVILAILLTAVIAAGGLYVMRIHPLEKVAAAPAPPPPVPIVAGIVAEHDVPIYLSGVGTVIAYNTDVVRAQIQGQIISINFTEGQTVHAGDLLAQIDPRPYQALIDQYTGNLERDQAQLVNAQANLTRYNTLGEKGWATPQLLETQKAQVGQLQAAIKTDQALVEAANVQLSFTRLTSPIDGTVGIRQIDVGNIISPSTTNGLVVVTQIDPISLIFTLPETNLPKIQQRQQKTNTPLDVLAYSQDDTTLLDQGVLGLVNNEILQTTGSIQLKANFANKLHKLWPGELVNARLLVDTRHDGLTVAASAVQQGPNGAYVYVINPDSKVETRPVKVAQISGGLALIDSGLKAKEQVVVDGQYKLQPGTRVTMLHGQAAQEAIAQSALQAPIP
jgi:multidrug efflux system membrane fusion protein